MAGGKTPRGNGDMIVAICYNDNVSKGSKFPQRVTIQLSDEDAAKIKRAAEREGLSISAFVRRTLLLLLRERLDEFETK